MTSLRSKISFGPGVLGIALVLGTPAAGTQPVASCTLPSIEVKQVCAVEDVIQARPGIPCEHDGKTYWMCCPRCVEAFAEMNGRSARHEEANEVHR